MIKQNVTAEFSAECLEHLMLEDSSHVAHRHLADGNPIFYGDSQYIGKVIKEYPSGKRELITFASNGNEVVEWLLERGRR